MPSIEPCEVPPNSLLRAYKAGAGFADCYLVEVPGAVTQEAFIGAFYTSPLFRVERKILKYLASRPATDADAMQLAAGKATKFSAWRVEKQSPSELLLADFTGRTRSWLMAEPVAIPDQPLVLRIGRLAARRQARQCGHGGRKAPHGQDVPCAAGLPSAVFASVVACSQQAREGLNVSWRVLLLLALSWPSHSGAQSRLPPDVIRFAERRDACDHFRGEEAYDAERRKFLEDRVRQLCTGTDGRLQALKHKYARQPKILRKLNGYETQIE
jgi:hypothetical protein